MKDETRSFLTKSCSDNYSNIHIHRTKFAVLFPRYQEKYIRESWDMISRIISSYGLYSKLDLHSGLMEVANNKNTIDPFVIIKARDFLKLLSRSVPVQQAAKIFDDDVCCDIINISRNFSNRKTFLKRRTRLIGNKGTTIKAIEIITRCYILVQGNTVSCMGKHLGLKTVRKIVEDCMDNIHPVLHVKSLIVKKELLKDKRFKNENWAKFLPPLKNEKKIFLAAQKIKTNIKSSDNIFLTEKNDNYNYEQRVPNSNKNIIKEMNQQLLDSYNILNFY
jgi:ribosomal RNA assembly protein